MFEPELHSSKLECFHFPITNSALMQPHQIMRDNILKMPYDKPYSNMLLRLYQITDCCAILHQLVEVIVPRTPKVQALRVSREL